MTAWLIEVAAQATLLMAAGIATTSLLKSQSAALRHFVLAATVVGSLSLPFLAATLPPVVTIGTTAISSRVARPATSVGMSPSVTATVDRGVSTDVDLRIAASTDQRTTSPVAPATVILWTWLAGVAVVGGTLLMALVRTQLIVRNSDDLQDQRWQDRAATIAVRLELPRPVQLRLQARRPLLAVWGWRRPVLLLPPQAHTWSSDRIDIVLAHEFAHVRRHDWVWQLLTEFLCTLHWYHPLAWQLRSRLRAASECACDDAVLADGVEGSVYATHLLALVRELRWTTFPALPTPAMARSVGLEGRVNAMLNPRLRRDAVSLRTGVRILAGVALLTLGVASVRAQSPLHTFSGVVLDPSGRALTEAVVLLTDATAQSKHEVRTDSSGHFRLVGLPAATYDLTLTRQGFQSLTESLTLSRDVDRELRLKVGTLQETITVTPRPAAPAAPDPDAQRRREESKRRFAEMQRLEQERCATAAAAAGAAGGRLFPPAKVVDVRPVYPASAQATGGGGVVTMKAVIGVDGFVREVTDLDGGDVLLQQAAADAVRQWQFTPTLLNCEPIDVEMHVTTRFAER